MSTRLEFEQPVDDTPPGLDGVRYRFGFRVVRERPAPRRPESVTATGTAAISGTLLSIWGFPDRRGGRSAEVERLLHWLVVEYVLRELRLGRVPDNFSLSLSAGGKLGSEPPIDVQAIDYRMSVDLEGDFLPPVVDHGGTLLDAVDLFDDDIEDERSAASSNTNPGELSVTADRSVFVIHGRNESLRKSMFEFLRSIDLQPLEWSDLVHSTGIGSPYVGEILEAAFRRAKAVVVLLSPDDLAILKEQFRHPSDKPYESQLTGQARPNVLFEAGMAFGTHSKHTILVQVGETRPFSDTAGRHVVRLSNAANTRIDLANRLRAAGCAVKLDGTDWTTVGDFTVIGATDELSEEIDATVLTLSDALEYTEQMSTQQKELLRNMLHDSPHEPSYHWTSDGSECPVVVMLSFLLEAGAIIPIENRPQGKTAYRLSKPFWSALRSRPEILG